MFWTFFITFLLAAYLWSRSYSDWISRVKMRNPPLDALTYEPLRSHNSLRLLQVLPRRLNSPLQIRMTEHLLPTTYKCLSYMWGDENDTRLLLVNGQMLQVRRNLWDFLDLASKQFPNEPLWIDAICINQEDFPERAQEVQRMGTIYREAAEVLIWLGADGTFRDLFRWINTTKWKSIPIPKPILHQLKLLIYHSYWERAWITQEVLLAKSARLLHSSDETNWKHIGDLVRALVDQNQPDAVHSFRTSHAIMLWKWQQDKKTLPGFEDGFDGADNTFWEVLNRRFKSKCFNPRDRIYSLLALIDGPTKLTVNYQESLAGLFWRAGERLGAWSKSDHVRTLAEALDLDSTSLRKSLRGHSDIVSIPVRQAYMANPLKTHATGVMVCQNGHVKHAFPVARRSRQDILLCPNIHKRTFDDSKYTHALVQQIGGSDLFTITTSQELAVREDWASDYSCELCHYSNDSWVTVKSWSYIQKYMKPEKPGNEPVLWMFRLPMESIIRCLELETRALGTVLQLPTVEAEQFTGKDRVKWLSNEPVRHRFARYVTDKKMAYSGAG